MTVDFSDFFWGEGQKVTGIEVLFQNSKAGVAAAKELETFFRELCSLSDSYSKGLSKLGKFVGNGGIPSSFNPLFLSVKAFTERLAAAHSSASSKVEDLLVKECGKYSEEAQKQYKAAKESEAPTLEAVQAYQNAKNMVSKCKALYLQRFLELEKLQKEGKEGKEKELEKAEGRLKKAQEEYKLWVEKYQAAVEEYVGKMTGSCKKFQDMEGLYLEKMKGFLSTYQSIISEEHEAVGQVHSSFESDCAALTVEELLEQFLRQKATGNTKPGANADAEDTFLVLEASQSNSNSSQSAEEKSSTSLGEKEKDRSFPIFEGNFQMQLHLHQSNSTSVLEPDRPPPTGSKGRRTTSLLNLFIPQSTQGSKLPAKGNGTDSPQGTENGPESPSNPALTRTNRGSKWFLRSRRGKKKDKDKKKEKDKEEDGTPEGPDSLSQISNDISASSGLVPMPVETASTSPKVDAEGFTIRPKDVWEEDTGKFYSDSDTDSEEAPEKRLHVEIKPLSNGVAPLSASVDELRTTVESLTLSSVNIMNRKVAEAEIPMKRSHSVSQQLGNQSPPSVHPYAPLSPSMSNAHNKTSPSIPTGDASRYAELGDLFAEVGEIQPALPPKMNSRSTPVPGTAIPRPPSRPRPEIPLISQRNTTNSPSPTVSRTDSAASLETRSLGSHFSGSRGPSPLTLGMNDVIPIAVAFHEIVHAYFKGNDENKCKVKMTGDMMVSFPAGIIQVFANNPSPAPLRFQVRSKQKLENLISNKNLVKVETVNDCLQFEFDMSALTLLLKSHAEQNSNASYFNVDILKYQIHPKPGATSCPLHLVAFWKCESSQTDLRIDYKYNSHAMEPTQSEVKSSPSKPSPPTPAGLTQVCIAAPVDGGVKTMQSKPSGQWFSQTNRACWKLSTLSTKSDNQGVGSLRARFEVTNGPSSNGTIAAQFSCENSTLSGCEFDLSCPGYRVSLVKKRFVSGKYICDSEENSNRYAVPPEIARPVQL